MSHPAACKDPENCTLSYIEHIRGFGVSSAALPTRQSEGAQTHIRQKRWDRDMESYKRLRKEGLRPPTIDGAALRERQGETTFDINERPVSIDYGDPMAIKDSVA